MALAQYPENKRPTGLWEWKEKTKKNAFWNYYERENYKKQWNQQLNTQNNGKISAPERWFIHVHSLP